MKKKNPQPKKFSYYFKKADAFNILYPVEHVIEISNAFRLIPEIITVDPRPAAGDIWDMGERKNDQGEMCRAYVLTNRALQRIAQAAEITFDPRHTHRTDDGRNPRRVEYQATGLLRRQDGHWMSITQSKEIDLDVIESEIRTELEVAAAGSGLTISRNGKEQILRPDNPECAREIARRIAVRMRLWKRNKVTFALTGATKRVIRALLLIKDFYTMEDLKKPFVVPRVSLDIDRLLEDGEIKKHFTASFLEQSLSVFGPMSEPERSRAAIGLGVHTAGGAL